MKETPDSGRLHIVLVGERNSGKSSLLNAIAGQRVAIVSDVAGTTTDRVVKAMEIPGLGACALIDTAGLDDTGELGRKRVEQSADAMRSADVAVVVVDSETGRLPELPLKPGAAVVALNKCENAGRDSLDSLAAEAEKKYGKTPVRVSALSGDGITELLDAVRENIPEDWNAPLLTEGLAQKGDTVVLVMPQDREAPKGRLILPQQQTLRELLDRGCTTVCCTAEGLQETLASLRESPKAIITDSQVLAEVKRLKPETTALTSFSMLLAASKGDMDYFRKSAGAIDRLGPSSKVLIAEACTHVPSGEDIGRVKIPGMLRKRAGEDLKVDVVSGRDFPEDLRGYDLVIHCGACMFNRRYALARVEQAKRQGVPMTNYGVTIAYINNLL